MAEPHLEPSPLDKFVALLQGYAACGKSVRNPVNVFNDELSASCNSEGGLKPGTRLANMDNDTYDSERKMVEELGRMWNREYLDPAELLKRMLASDRPMPSDSLDAILLNIGDPDEYENISRYLNLEELRRLTNCTPTKEGWNHMGMAEEVITSFETLFMGQPYVTNPLVAMAQREQELEGPIMEAGERERALVVFESLSKRLWHMATVVDTETLRARILLQDDSGASDLATLASFADLIGVSSDAEGSEIVTFDFDSPF